MINKQADSLYSLIADGKPRRTLLSRDTWKKLIGSQASLQLDCVKDGFNAISAKKKWAKARIGIVGNNKGRWYCSSHNSRIGFGTGGNPDDSNTCGNAASNEKSDNGP